MGEHFHKSELMIKDIPLEGEFTLLVFDIANREEELGNKINKYVGKH